MEFRSIQQIRKYFQKGPVRVPSVARAREIRVTFPLRVRPDELPTAHIITPFGIILQQV